MVVQVFDNDDTGLMTFPTPGHDISRVSLFSHSWIFFWIKNNVLVWGRKKFHFSPQKDRVSETSLEWEEEVCVCFGGYNKT
jgi:hypothetical protein